MERYELLFFGSKYGLLFINIFIILAKNKYLYKNFIFSDCIRVISNFHVKKTSQEYKF